MFCIGNPYAVMYMELCIGTVQFGLDYGIRGQKKPDLKDAIDCLDYAVSNGISAIDTARAYGTAEEVVGEFLKQGTVKREKLFISTKLKPNILDDYKSSEYERVIERELQKQLKTLHTDYVDAYIFHSARYAFDNDKIAALSKVKQKGMALKTGVSVYEPKEALACYGNPFVDFMQMPYSIFDHRMKDEGIFDSAEKGKCEIHTRSAFIQGLITMEAEDVPPYLKKAKPIIKKIKELCAKENVSPVKLALQYVKREPSISHLVFGVDSKEQLAEDISLFNENIDANLLEDIGKEFDGIEAEIVMPSLWKK